MLTVFLTFTYKGKGQFEIHQRRFTLEFSKHHQVLKTSLEPNEIVQRLQEDVDGLTDQVERHEVRKHPEQKEQKEALKIFLLFLSLWLSNTYGVSPQVVVLLPNFPQ